MNKKLRGIKFALIALFIVKGFLQMFGYITMTSTDSGFQIFMLSLIILVDALTDAGKLKD